MKRLSRHRGCASTASVVVALGAANALGQTGPDVIVGELPDVTNYAAQTVDGVAYRAFSVGTTSCNIGTVPLNWVANTNQHPVIGQNLFRLANGRFEHIGQAWLKHGFTALQGTVCSSCTANPNGTRLGVGCSDPYSSSLNGTQSGLGPKWEVNATSGFYPYPYTDSSGSGSVFKRLRVRQSDLDIAGATYFVEGHYVTPDDAAAGNLNNNASYRRVNINASYQMSLTGTTQRTRCGLQAWADTDPEVRLVSVDVPGGGRFWVASKATVVDADTWNI